MPYSLKLLRERCSTEQNHRCCYCGYRTNEGNDKQRIATLEHLIPQSKKGKDTYENCVMACYECNRKRGSIKLETFINIVLKELTNQRLKRQRIILLTQRKNGV